MTLVQSQRQNFLDVLKEELRGRVEEEETGPEIAFGQLVLDLMGYDRDLGEYTDGKGDHGIDYWELGEASADLFQFKATTDVNLIDLDRSVPPDELGDLRRIVELLEGLPEVPKKANAGVIRLLTSLPHALSRHAEQSGEPFEISIFFAALGGELSDQAQDEFTRIANSVPSSVAGHAVTVSVQPLLTDRLLEEKWKSTNTEWRDITGRKRDKIRLRLGAEDQLLDEPKSLVFYSRAIDLVKAFQDFGYQLFEPNVRCEVKNSKVNRAIRASVRSARGRRDFRHLNNGIALICVGFSKKGKPIREIDIVKPGVINGLQTVKSISDAYHDLDAEDKAHFDEHCQVMVRLYVQNAVADYRELVKSTNTQNPMQSRNLRSNDPEQVAFERLFAEQLGWFYERKEGAWLAYKSNPRLWGSMQGIRLDSFQIPETRKYRTVDNMDVAQSWLSFLGYSSQAVHEKSVMFDDDGFYSVVFLHRPASHGSTRDYAFQAKEIIAESRHTAPPAHALQLAYLLRQTVRQLIPSPHQNKSLAIQRLGLSNKPKEEVDLELAMDFEYLEGVIFRAWSFLFPDFVGHVLFRVFGEDAYDAMKKALSGGWLGKLLNNPDYASLSKALEEEDFEADDFLVVMWQLFRRCGADLLRSPWLESWKQAPVRTRFNYSRETRARLVEELNQIDKFLENDQILRPWAKSLNEAKGIYSYVKTTLG